MLSSKPICKNGLIAGEHCKLCPIKASCKKAEALWKNLFVKKEEVKNTQSIMVG